MERSEYLKRPFIEGVVYEITSSKVRIATSNTIFLEVHMGETVQLFEVEMLFRQLKKIAATSERLKLKGVSKFLPTVRDLYPQYCQDIRRKRVGGRRYLKI